MIPVRMQLRARITAQAPGVLSGVAVAARIARRSRLRVRALRSDGAPVRPGDVVLEVEGNGRRLLGAERTILNYLMHLSGVASRTRTAVRSARGRIAILATRKTIPGLRDLEKAAVVHGGGEPHRRDLSDALLVKTPHLAAVGLVLAVRAALRHAHRRAVEVEVRSPAQAVAAVRAGARRLLLDNMSPARVRETDRALRRLGLRAGVYLEVSGGLSPENVGRYASTGADAASLGSLTHSARALPFHLELVPARARRSRAR